MRGVVELWVGLNGGVGGGIECVFECVAEYKSNVRTKQIEVWARVSNSE
jgi:hypothetical protein